MALARKKTDHVRKLPRRSARKSSPAMMDARQVVQRIDAMIRELELLRQVVLPRPATPPGLTEKLFGALGHGTWNEYDMDLEWKRFSEWQHR